MGSSEMDRVAVATIGDVLTDTIDMGQVDAGEGEPYEIAAIDGVSKRSPEMQGLRIERALTLSWKGRQAILSAPGWANADWKQRLSLIQAVLAIFSCIPDAPDSRLRWLFSGKTVTPEGAADLLDQWIEDRAPPVMDVIEFIVEDLPAGRSIRTSGLFAIAGHEIEAVADSAAGPELARMVGRLAQQVLTTGPIEAGTASGPDGASYHLKRGTNDTTRLPMISVTRPKNGGLDQTLRA